jgi:hypothetical protein
MIKRNGKERKKIIYFSEKHEKKGKNSITKYSSNLFQHNLSI